MVRPRMLAGVLAAMVFASAAAGQLALGRPSDRAKGKADPSAPPAEPQDQVVGEYAGTFTSSAGKTAAAVAYVLAQRQRGQDAASYQASLRAVESGLIEKTVIGPDAKLAASVDLRGPAGDEVTLTARDWKGQVARGKLTAEGKAGKFALSRVVRKSPTELSPPPPGAIVLLPYAEGKAPSLGEWADPKWPALGDGSVMAKGGDTRTKRQFSKLKLHVEFWIPTFSRGRGNSGVYILDRYEIQILDSFGGKANRGGCAAVYQTFAPAVNASLPPARWQTFDITFAGPKMDGEKVLKLPRVTVVHNGVKVHDDVEVPHATGNARSKGHAETGPIRLQDHGNPVRFRNVWIQELN